MADSFELEPVDALAVATVGEPGRRQFFIQARGGGRTVTLACEKFHIEGLVARIRQEYGQPMGVVATGGLAPLFDGATEIIEHIDPNLTLWGLRLIYERNRKRNP